jgi:hypothetical protein
VGLQVHADDGAGNQTADWDGTVTAADPEDDADPGSTEVPPGSQLDEHLTTGGVDLEGEDDGFQPGVVPDASGAHASSAGVTVTPPSGVRARLAATGATPGACGRDKYNQTPFDTFRVKFGRVGETDDGDRYFQYHLHYQVRLAWRADVAWTWLAAQRFFPNGNFDPSPYDDSRDRLVRDPVHWKPYYAHFLRLKVKPGSLITFWGRWQFTTPIEVAEGTMIGAHQFGACFARLNG